LQDQTSQEHFDLAISYFLKAIELDHTNQDCYIGIGEAFEKKDDLQKSLQFLLEGSM
jgi:hypothetical protein